MTTRATSSVISLLLLLGITLMPSAARADRYPCGDLLLPYFEVQLVEQEAEQYEAPTALFSVGNCGNDVLPVRITIWTNWAVPVLKMDLDLEPKSLHPFHLRDWLAFGVLPDRVLGDEELAQVQAALCGDPSPRDNKYYGTKVADRLAVGFITIDSVAIPMTDTFDLWGDFFAVNPRHHQTAGESLVRLVGDETREVCDRHLIRFMESPPATPGSAVRIGGPVPPVATRMVFWTGVGGSPSWTVDPNFTLPVARCQLYDEAGEDLGAYELPLLATQAFRVKDLGWPEPFGWADCVTPTTSFVCVNFTTEDHSTMTLRSFCEEPEQEEPEPGERASIVLEKATNGEDADRPPGPELVEGQEVVWTYTVYNTGHVPLTSITVRDDHGVTAECPADRLEPGEAMTCYGHGEAVVGSYRNIGSVEGFTPRGVVLRDSDPSHYLGNEDSPPPPPPPPPPAPAVSLEKATNGEDADLPPGPVVTVGSRVVWTYLVTNTGNTDLTSLSVVDDQGVTVLCPVTSLAPGELMTCRASGVAEEGQYSNLGIVTGLDPESRPVTDDDPSHYLGEEEPPPLDPEGCTPGYWKNHPEAWMGYPPDQTVTSVFPSAALYSAPSTAILSEALGFGGGPGAEGAAQILLRAAVASLLNASHSGVHAFPWTPGEVIVMTDNALAGGDRDAMLALAAVFDTANNAGCPL